MTTSDRTFQILGSQLGDAAVRAAASQAYIEQLEAMLNERDQKIRQLEGELSDVANGTRIEAPAGYPNPGQDVLA
jgi:ABC-type Fe2+-enterobactin transport system substrate-binding protein